MLHSSCPVSFDTGSFAGKRTALGVSLLPLPKGWVCLQTVFLYLYRLFPLPLAGEALLPSPFRYYSSPLSFYFLFLLFFSVSLIQTSSLSVFSSHSYHQQLIPQCTPYDLCIFILPKLLQSKGECVLSGCHYI